MGFGQRTTEHGEVLAEHEHQTAVDGAVAGHHPVTWDVVLVHAEVGTAVLDEHVPFLEAATVEQHLDALTCGQLALLVLGVDTLLAAAQAGRSTLLFELFKDFFHHKSF